MADNYQVLDHERTIQVIGNTVNEIELVTIATIPTGVQATISIPEEVWQANQGGELPGSVATQIENLVTYEHVIGGTPSQDIDNNRLLQLFVDLIVRYDRLGSGLPPLDGVTSVPVSSFYLADLGIGGYVPPGAVTPVSYVAAEYGRLKALAGG